MGQFASLAVCSVVRPSVYFFANTMDCEFFSGWGVPRVFSSHFSCGWVGGWLAPRSLVPIWYCLVLFGTR
jgi:hypothetical protein